MRRYAVMRATVRERQSMLEPQMMTKELDLNLVTSVTEEASVVVLFAWDRDSFRAKHAWLEASLSFHFS